MGNMCAANGSIRNPPRGNCRAKSGLKFCRADIVNGIKGFTGDF